MSQIPTLLLSGLAVLLAGVVLFEYSAGAPEYRALNRPSRVAPASPPQAGTPPAADQTGNWADTALARPLFSRSRRPPPGAVSAQAAAPGIPRLTAVLVSADGRSAIFAGSAGGKPIVAHEGSQIGDHLVQTIADGQVTVIGPDGAHVLRPSFAGGSPPGAASSGGAPVAVPTGEPATPSLLDQIRFGKSAGVGIPGLLPPVAPNPAPGG